MHCTDFLSTFVCPPGHKFRRSTLETRLTSVLLHPLFSKSTHVKSCKVVSRSFLRVAVYIKIRHSSSSPQFYFRCFNMRLKGFREPPCDHYARPFWSAVPHDVNEGVIHEKCINSQPQHKIQLDYLKSLLRAYPAIPKFGFTFLSSLCHGKTILPLGAAEKDFLEFFKSIWKLGYLNDTMLVVMGDHGARTGDFRYTLQGKLEERLPMLSIALPIS